MRTVGPAPARAEPAPDVAFGRMPAHDYTLEARPWGVPFDTIGVPFEVWYGEDDHLVSPEQGRILAAHLPQAATHGVPGQGHLLWFTHHAEDILRSAVMTTA